MSPQIADWCQNENVSRYYKAPARSRINIFVYKTDHHHNPVPFPKTRQLPIGWSNLTVVLPETELYDKALLFFENTSGNMTALLNTGNICVNISSNYTLENRSILSPIRFSGVAAKYSSTLIYDLIPGTRSSAPFTLAAEFSSDLTVTMLICGDSCSSTLWSFYLLYTNTSHEFFTASPWHLIDDIDKRISS